MQVLLATGREPNTASLNLPAAGITLHGGGLDKRGHVVVDKYQDTVTQGVHAVGDVCGKVELTPMAIAAGRRLADRWGPVLQLTPCYATAVNGDGVQ